MHSFLQTIHIGPFVVEMTFPEIFDGYSEVPDHIYIYGTTEDLEDLVLLESYWKGNVSSNMWKGIAEKLLEIHRQKYIKSEEMFLRIREDMKKYLDIMAKYP